MHSSTLFDSVYAKILADDDVTIEARSKFISSSTGCAINYFKKQDNTITPYDIK